MVTDNWIACWELSKAFRNHSYDFIAWDASLMQMIEIAYELRQHARYIVGSQESPPAAGYPYTEIFGQLNQNPSMTPIELAKAFVESTLYHPQYLLRRITQSVLDTSKLPLVAQKVHELVQQFEIYRSEVEPAIKHAREHALRYTSSPSYFFYDFIDVLEKLLAYGVPDPVAHAVTQLRDALTESVLFEGHNKSCPNSHGVSVEFSSRYTFSEYRNSYLRLQFDRDTHWSKWLFLSL
jgi:hypothetical protein